MSTEPDAPAGRPDATQPSIVARVTAWVKARLEWFQATRVGRLNARYNAVNGGQLAGGIAYAALFSVFSLLAIAFTVFVRVVGNNPELRDAVVRALDEALPGIIDTGSNGGLLAPEDLVLTDGTSWAGLVAAVTLVFSGLAVMGALSSSLRAVFGLVAPPGNAVIAKLRDLSGFLVLGLAVLTTAMLGIAAGAAGAWATDLLGLESDVTRVLVRGLGLLGAFGVDALVFAAVMRVIAGARPLRRDLWTGALLGAAASSVLRLLGTSVVGGAADRNALLASFATLATLLVWVNLVARITLYVAAWTANPPSPVVAQVSMEDLHVRERPNYVTLSAPETLAWDHDAHTGLVQPSEASRLEREARERAEDARLAEVQAALEAALTEPEGWLARRRRLRRARDAARELRG